MSTTATSAALHILKVGGKLDSVLSDNFVGDVDYNISGSGSGSGGVGVGGGGGGGDISSSQEFLGLR